ncbi:VOC family protein [Marinivivus vitaminiproducens]|uniref:VOC family protein n=1 Tax=Marinivivus vitaminiproducens TaxID=3035935 RepID=UPI00279DC5F7|nr:VOC family protein [Geminicoccaceae bacterium SCSIO 64248]
MSKLMTCLWFDGQAEEAANFYVDTFKACGREASLGETLRIGEAGPSQPTPDGKILTIDFTLDGQDFLGLNGGSDFQFTPAISLLVRCRDQAEVDAFWDGLQAGGGKPMECGWLTDRFGVAWQITPTILLEMSRDADMERAGRVMRAMMTMTKLDVAGLKAAYDAPS